MTGKDINKQLGMLLGLHCGDSLGAPMEFCHKNPSLSHTEMIAGSRIPWRPGQATDDTEMALMVLKSISLQELDVERLRRLMINWFLSEPMDVGDIVRAAIERMAEGRQYGGLNIPNGEGNGSLMRVAPLALLEVSEDQLGTICRQQTILTHGNPSCQIADFVLVRLLRAALAGASRDDLYRLLLNDLFRYNLSSEAITMSAERRWSDLPNSGWIVNSLSVLAWTLKHAREFEEAVIKAVNLGGDADTNGAIVGSVWGALKGENAIPEKWLSKIELRWDFCCELERLNMK